MSILKRLLPQGTLWDNGPNSTLSKLIAGLDVLASDFKTFADLIWLRIFPASTDQIDQWDQEFGLFADPSLSTAERRERLAGRWAAQGGQSVAYIEATLAAAGFDSLSVYEWPADAMNPPTPRDPTALTGSPAADFGNTSAQFGDDALQFGPGFAGAAYWLVNNEFDPVKYPIRTSASQGVPAQFGNTAAQFGDTGIQFGGPGGDPIDLRAYYLYICGDTFGEVVNLPANRRRDLESLLLRITPAQQWLILTVEYS